MKGKGRHVFTKAEQRRGYKNAIKAIMARHKCKRKKAISLIFWTADLRKITNDPWLCGYDD